MNDMDFDLALPPERELPPETRAKARQRIMSELAGPARPRGGVLVPVSIAAGVLVVVAGAAVLVNTTEHQQQHSPAAAPTTAELVPPNGDYTATPETVYQVQHAAAPAADNARCAAQTRAGLPAVTTWRPIITATANGVTMIAYRTPAGALFCEVTPTTVTLSGITTGHGEAPTFATDFGSVAGLDPTNEPLDIGPADVYGKPVALTAVADGVFVAPNAFRVTGGGMLMNKRTVAQPPVTPPVNDRPAPDVNAISPLTQCFAQGTAAPVVNPSGWLPGATVPLNDHETMQLGSQAGLLLSCVLNRQPTVPEPAASVEIPNGENLGAPDIQATAPDPEAFTYRVFYDFRTAGTGGYDSSTYAIIGLLRDKQVTKVELVAPHEPDIAGFVHNGTFIVPSISAPVYDAPGERNGEFLLLFGPSDTLIARLPLAD